MPDAAAWLQGGLALVLVLLYSGWLLTGHYRPQADSGRIMFVLVTLWVITVLLALPPVEIRLNRLWPAVPLGNLLRSGAALGVMHSYFLLLRGAAGAPDQPGLRWLAPAAGLLLIIGTGAALVTGVEWETQNLLIRAGRDLVLLVFTLPHH